MGALLFFVIFVILGSSKAAFSQEQVVFALVVIAVAEAFMWNWIWMREIKERYKEKS